jgi:hypothetical protein
VPWHATRVGEYHEGDITMHLQVIPPLSSGTAWIEFLVAGQPAEVRATGRKMILNKYSSICFFYVVDTL